MENDLALSLRTGTSFDLSSTERVARIGLRIFWAG
jgi:hypothetical protein